MLNCKNDSKKVFLFNIYIDWMSCLVMFICLTVLDVHVSSTSDNLFVEPPSYQVSSVNI